MFSTRQKSARIVALMGLLIGLGVILKSPVFVIFMLFAVFFVTIAAMTGESFAQYGNHDPRRIAARTAMQRADYEKRAGEYLLGDIGLLVYFGDKREPRIYRTSDIPTDATHIRPFVVLDTQHIHPVNGEAVTICFDMFDEEGKRHFIARTRHIVNPDENFVTPNTWLPLAEQGEEGIWAMEVSVDNMLIGVHEFGWLPVGGEVRSELNGDGEIDPRTRRWVELRMQEAVTVDDLLEEQGVEVQEQEAGR